VKPWSPEVPERVRARGHLHLFADFDGTLSPIAPTPEEAVLPDEARRLLERLVARPATTVAIVSGRTIETLERKVGVDGVLYIGNHGMEWKRGGERHEHPVATRARPAVKRLAPAFAALVRQHGGILEDKGISLSLHTRLITDDAVRTAVEAQARELAAHEPDLEPFGGKCIVEVRPRGAPHKGAAILAQLVHDHGAGWVAACAAVFLGDDLTDEDGFRALGPDGISVFVDDGRHRSSTAQYVAAGIPDTLRLLESLV
jgi:trehalose-phosphatase